MRNALDQSLLIMPQQEELAYRIVIHTDYTGQMDDAIAGKSFHSQFLSVI